MADLNINEMVPRYMQIIQYFVDKIDRGILDNGDKLPTEEEICKIFNVSRITTRQALNELANAGYIVKKQGLGSYVKKKMKMQLNSLQGFSEEMTRKGLYPEQSCSLLKYAVQVLGLQKS